MPDSQIRNSESRQHPAPEEFHILKTSADNDFSNLLFLCSQIAGARFSALVILENGKTWVKSTYGLPLEELNTDAALWEQVLERDEIYCFGPEDLLTSGMDHDSLIAVPVITETGEKLGIIALFDPEDENLDTNQKRSLKILVNQILSFIAFKKQNNQFQRVQQDLERILTPVSAAAVCSREEPVAGSAYALQHSVQ